MSDNTTPLDFDTWWSLYEDLKGSPWEAEDLASAVEGIAPVTGQPAAEALKYVYDLAKEWEGPIDPEDGVAAAMNAVYDFAAMNGWAPLWLKEMADHFAVMYESMDDPMQDRLDENYSRMPLEWLGDHGRKELEDEVCGKDSEIWIDGEFPGVWVFNKPGRKP